MLPVQWSCMAAVHRLALSTPCCRSGHLQCHSQLLPASVKLRFALWPPEYLVAAASCHAQQLWCAERALSAQDAEKQRAELREHWDFSVILDCLEVFEEEIDLSTTPHIERLEDALVESTGAGPCLLADIHLVRRRKALLGAA